MAGIGMLLRGISCNDWVSSLETFSQTFFYIIFLNINRSDWTVEKDFKAGFEGCRMERVKVHMNEPFGFYWKEYSKALPWEPVSFMEVRCVPCIYLLVGTRVLLTLFESSPVASCSYYCFSSIKLEEKK